MSAASPRVRFFLRPPLYSRIFGTTRHPPQGFAPSTSSGSCNTLPPISSATPSENRDGFSACLNIPGRALEKKRVSNRVEQGQVTQIEPPFQPVDGNPMFKDEGVSG